MSSANPLEEPRHDRFTLEIDGQRFENWSEIELRQSLDCFSSVGFLAPFDPERREFRDVFRPFSFTPVKLYLRDELVFTGQLTNVEPTTTAEGRSVRVQCSSRPTVLETCCIPTARTKRIKIGGEFRAMNLFAIAGQLCEPFGFTAVSAGVPSDEAERADFLAPAKRRDLQKKVEEALNATYPKVRLEPDATVHDFLCVLAKQRGLVMTDDALGNLFFQKPVSVGNAVEAFEEGVPPLLSVSSHFSPDEYFSEVTCCVPKKRGSAGGMFTQTNPFARSDLVRPLTVKAQDTKPGDAPAAARARLGRMLGNMASWDIKVPTLFDRRGRRFRANTTIILKAPGAMVFGRHELLVRDVTLHQDNESSSAQLGLVLPGAFSDEMPSALPWDEAL